MLEKTANPTPVSPCCKNCQHVLLSDSSQTGYRCGKTYFSAPPRDRKPVPYRNYPEVLMNHGCAEWRGKS